MQRQYPLLFNSELDEIFHFITCPEKRQFSLRKRDLALE